MRFTVTAEIRRNHLLQTIIVLFLVFVVLLWLSNAFLYFGRMGLSYNAVVEHYLGSPGKFMQPRSYQGMLEVAHFHLFAMGILLLTLTHLMLFVPLSPRWKLWLIVAPFVSALIDEASGWLVRFVNPLFAWLKIGGFIALEASLLMLIIVSFWATFRGSQNGYGNGNGPDRINNPHG